jgi:AraC-like DNA-binding protein
VRRAREYLDARPTRPVTLAELAAAAGVTPWHLVRAFTRAVGVPPHAYHVHRRLGAARQALAAGARVADVALDHGFAHQSHFTRLFSRYSDISPARYALLCRGALDGKA